LISSALIIMISSDVTRTNDKADIARRTPKFMIAVQIRHQLIPPTDSHLRMISRKAVYQAPGVCSTAL
jgi:hypothetical protein